MVRQMLPHEPLSIILDLKTNHRRRALAGRSYYGRRHFCVNAWANQCDRTPNKDEMYVVDPKKRRHLAMEKKNDQTPRIAIEETLDDHPHLIVFPHRASRISSEPLCAWAVPNGRGLQRWEITLF